MPLERSKLIFLKYINQFSPIFYLGLLNDVFVLNFITYEKLFIFFIIIRLQNTVPFVRNKSLILFIRKKKSCRSKERIAVWIDDTKIGFLYLTYGRYVFS